MIEIYNFQRFFSILGGFVMFLLRLLKGPTILTKQVLKSVRFVSNEAVRQQIHQRQLPENIRNIGIIAHVDAGKTTTTERMLYYSGCINQMGTVDSGDTVMDFLEEERNRGITINAAAVSFNWRKDNQNFAINVIDTPGHVDFAVEVERSLFVLDGAVIVLDSSAGVEAQTLSVMQRAKAYNIPTIAFLNKLDKINADLEMSLSSIEKQLNIKPLLLQLPMGTGRVVEGVVDLVQMKTIKYKMKEDPNGRILTVLDKIPDSLNENVAEKRKQLVENVAHLSDEFAESFLSVEDPMSCDLNEKLQLTIQNLCRDNAAMPVFCGSALKNVGIQPLLDGIVDILPSPVAKYDKLKKSKIPPNCSAALIFKTGHDRNKGPLSFCRFYSGNIKKGSMVYCDGSDQGEKIQRIYKVMADDMIEIEEAIWGGIYAVTGLKNGTTGSIFSNKKLAESDMKKLSTVLPLNRLKIPPAVYSCSVGKFSLFFCDWF